MPNLVYGQFIANELLRLSVDVFEVEVVLIGVMDDYACLKVFICMKQDIMVRSMVKVRLGGQNTKKGFSHIQEVLLFNSCGPRI